jgi:hypothetical protein
MSNPKQAVLFAKATKEEAMALWADLKDNDQFTLCQVVITRGLEAAHCRAPRSAVRNARSLSPSISAQSAAVGI